MSDPRITSGDPLAGYTTRPPPGAGGVASADPFGAPTAGHWQLAGWWRRVGAHLLDGVVITVIAAIFFGIFSWSVTPRGSSRPSSRSSASCCASWSPRCSTRR